MTLQVAKEERAQRRIDKDRKRTNFEGTRMAAEDMESIWKEREVIKEFSTKELRDQSYDLEVLPRL